MKKLEQLTTISYPNPILQTSCEPVKSVGYDELRIARRLKQIMLEHDGRKSKWIGVGMSANQIGITKQIFCINPTKPRGQDQTARLKIRDRNTYFAFNPVILKHGKESVTELEGCLSDQSIYVKKQRWQVIEVEYLNESNQVIQEKLTGWHAKVFQHECDHIHGKLVRNNV